MTTDPDPTDHCTMINPLCPDDLCVLPYGHPGTPKNEHLLGTMYGSSWGVENLKEALKHRKHFSKKWFKMLPKGTSYEEVVRAGWRARPRDE